MRTPYTLKENELEMLLNGMTKYGADKTFDVMKKRSLASMEDTKDSDEILMDQYETVLKRARGLSIENEEDEQLQKSLYQLSSLLRVLAHDIYREYLKTDKERNNKRFLRLVK